MDFIQTGFSNLARQSEVAGATHSRSVRYTLFGIPTVSKRQLEVLRGRVGRHSISLDQSALSKLGGSLMSDPFETYDVLCDS